MCDIAPISLQKMALQLPNMQSEPMISLGLFIRESVRLSSPLGQLIRLFIACPVRKIDASISSLLPCEVSFYPDDISEVMVALRNSTNQICMGACIGGRDPKSQRVEHKLGVCDYSDGPICTVQGPSSSIQFGSLSSLQCAREWTADAELWLG